MVRWLAATIALLGAAPTLAAPCHPGLSTVLFPTLIAAASEPRGTPLRALLAKRAERDTGCRDASCRVAAGRWSDADRDALAAAADRDPALQRRAAAADERPSAAIAREIDGLNLIVDVYAGTRAPRYPVIDGPDSTAASDARIRFTERAVALASSCAEGTARRVDGVGLATALLSVHDRADAVAWADPAGDVRVRRRLATTDWSRYPYTALIVPGVGPETPGTALSAGGEDNVRCAADRFRQRLAPLIIVSGGAVHPRRTRFVEAIEMRRALVERYGIPADAVLIDPYARHTTTNLRNATRRLASVGVPIDRDTLIITNAQQSGYIAGSEFAARNLRELGYLPGTVGARINPTDLVFRPSPRSFRIDPADPLDP